MTFTRVSRELKISRDIARLLSQATYHQLVLALRELVANSHDSNAAHVRLSLDLKDRTGGAIKVLDDGDGMSPAEFDQEFLTVGRTTKLPVGGASPRLNRFGRPIIGRFGIGFIAAIPFAHEVMVETKQRESPSVTGVRIDCDEILAGTGSGEETSFSFPGWSRSPTVEDLEKFTRVEMLNLSARSYESIDTSIRSGWYETRERRGDPIGSARRTSYIRDWLSRILPLGYRDVDESSNLRTGLSGLLPPSYIPPAVLINGRRVARTISEARSFETFELAGKAGDWSARGILWSPHEAIEPVFARGIAIRVGDMSIGEPGYLGLNSMGRVFGKLQHIGGEVQVTGLDAALQLDRQGFYPTPSTDEFLEQVRQKVIKFESRLQRKATVMQRFRSIKKLVDVADYHAPSPNKVAPVLDVPRHIDKLVEEAKAVGIEVRHREGDELVVPKGEGRVLIGSSFGEHLLQVRVGRKVVRFTMNPNLEPMKAGDLLARLTRPNGSAPIELGPHTLLASDDSAIANLRLLAVLRLAVLDSTLTISQAEVLIEQLAQTYG